MNLEDLTAIGLSPSQASTYDFLIKQGAQKPANIAARLRMTRTNAYKVLDSLTELGIVEKTTSGKTLTYAPANPIALASLTARYRAEAVARENTVNQIMHDLLATYSKHTSKIGVEVFQGQEKVAEAYRKQLNLREDIEFIHTKNDVPMMGFDVMHDIRTTPSRHGKKRQGIMEAPNHTQINFVSHKRSNLDITWLEAKKYTEPVEWSVTKSSLLIVSYTNEPQAILIIDTVVAAAFSQIFQLLKSYLSTESVHQKIDELKPKAV